LFYEMSCLIFLRTLKHWNQSTNMLSNYFIYQNGNKHICLHCYTNKANQVRSITSEDDLGFFTACWNWSFDTAGVAAIRAGGAVDGTGRLRLSESGTLLSISNSCSTVRSNLFYSKKQFDSIVFLLLLSAL
jgi:hypothetical protein